MRRSVYSAWAKGFWKAISNFKEVFFFVCFSSLQLKDELRIQNDNLE